MKKKFVFFLVSCLLLLLLAAGLFLSALSRRRLPVNYWPLRNPVQNRTLENPYRGWYHLYGYLLSDTEPVSMEDVSRISGEYPYEIVLLEINLKNYADSDISQDGLNQLTGIFSGWKEAGKQLIVRFLYDWDGRAVETEPESISVIKRHMEQTADCVNSFKDCIYLLQGIYVGNCGEMNNSAYMEEDSMCELADYLASVIDPSVFLSVRTPAHWRTINQTYEPLGADSAFDGSPAARFGLFNDGMLGSGNDLGTYGDVSLTLAEQYSDKGTREEELAFQNRLCSYVPNGGEVVLDNPYNDFSNALADLRQMRVSYLNCLYDGTVLDKWRFAVYQGDDCFSGTNGFDYIGSHLGYRYALTASEFEFQPLKDDAAVLRITIENSGFSASLRMFSSELTAVNQETGNVYRIPIDADSRCWPGSDSATLSVSLNVRDWQTGNYVLYYSLKDPVLDRRIALANALVTPDCGYPFAVISLHK